LLSRARPNAAWDCGTHQRAGHRVSGQHRQARRLRNTYRNTLERRRPRRRVNRRRHQHIRLRVVHRRVPGPDLALPSLAPGRKPGCSLPFQRRHSPETVRQRREALGHERLFSQRPPPVVVEQQPRNMQCASMFQENWSGIASLWEQMRPIDTSWSRAMPRSELMLCLRQGPSCLTTGHPGGHARGTAGLIVRWAVWPSTRDGVTPRRHKPV